MPLMRQAWIPVVGLWCFALTAFAESPESVKNRELDNYFSREQAPNQLFFEAARWSFLPEKAKNGYDGSKVYVEEMLGQVGAETPENRPVKFKKGTHSCSSD